MLSRRSVRIKVMQLLYMLNRDEHRNFAELAEDYNNGIWRTFDLYIFQCYVLLKVCQQAEVDAHNRTAKLLPSEEDKHFMPLLYTNPCVQSLANHVGFLNLVSKQKGNEGIDSDYLWKIYRDFEETQECKAYMEKGTDTADEDHRKVLLELYRFLCGHELFNEITEDRFSNWPDDESLVVGAIKKTIKAMPLEGEFYKEFEPSDETVREFGEHLLLKTCQEDQELFTHIEPALKNWEADRVAVLDMIMLKMALCELLFFPTIPTKVTLNEYVEISKVYSTEKSKEFINGILDRLMKKLTKEERIVKEGRGLIE